MVRSSPIAVRSSLLLLALALPLTTCGGDGAGPRLRVDRPVRAVHPTPSPVAVLTGLAEHASVLRLRLKTGEETFTFEARPGRHLAFVIDAKAGRVREIAWPGEDATPPSVEQTATALTERLTRLDVAARVVEPSGARAFVVEVREGAGDEAGRIVQSLTAPSGRLRLLLEVLPSEQYRRDSPEDARGTTPWPDTAEAFALYKADEADRYREARAKGVSYEPSRSDLVLVPRARTEANQVSDFAVLAWPEDPGRRADGSWIAEARVATDMMGRPAVLCDLHASQADAFEAFTREILHLPLALVWRDRVHIAPYVQAPLRDNVQITLGTGQTYAEVKAEAREMVAVLEGGGLDTLPVRLVADVIWVRPPAFEVLLPLGATPEVELEIRAFDRRGRSADPVARTLQFRPQVEEDLSEQVTSLVAAVELGLLDEAFVVTALRPDVARSVGALSGMLHGEGEAAATVPRRRLALRLLVKLDASSPSVLQAIAASCRHDPDAEIRKEAATLLGRFRELPDEALAALEAALADPDVDVRRAAARAIPAFEEKAALRLPQLLAAAARDPEGVGRGLASVPWELHDWALPVWLAGSEDDDAQVRAFAVARLGHFTDGRALEVLLARLEDADVAVRGAAVQSLQIRELYLGESDVPVARARALLASPHAVVRAWAAHAVGRGGETDDDTTARLRTLLDDEETAVRYRAAEALDALGRSDARSDAILEELRALERRAMEAAEKDQR